MVYWIVLSSVGSELGVRFSVSPMICMCNSCYMNTRGSYNDTCTMSQSSSYFTQGPIYRSVLYPNVCDVQFKQNSLGGTGRL